MVAGRAGPAVGAALGLAAVFLVAVTGCASVRAARARAEALERGLDGLRYQRPMDEVWDAVRRLAAERDFPLAGKDAAAVGQEQPAALDRIFSPGRETYPYGERSGLLQQLGIVSAAPPAEQRGRSLDSGWRRSGDRLHADALEGADGIRVVLWRIHQDPAEHQGRKPERDVELELELARRLAPEAAARVEQGAAARP